ncbi:MAG: VCBS repeat-containing protein [Acidobacteria bacterium]|nr:VCBS repeat-containing protein [Acidobacteriota bacterium]
MNLVLADFNRDGKNDLAVANAGSGSISLLLGRGNGTFQTPVVISLVDITGLGRLLAGDFNQDGNLDVVVSATTSSAGDVDLLLLGNGDGTFQTQAAIPGTYGFLDGKAADLNGDGFPDLVTSTAGNTLQVLLGNGDGTFTPQPDLSMNAGFYPGVALSLVVADVNSDGKPDIVAADVFNNVLHVFAGLGDGTFLDPTFVTTTNDNPDSLTAADFNGDGKVDLLTGYGPPSASLAWGDGSGNFDFSAECFVYGQAFPSQTHGDGALVNVADLNLDGKPDAMVLDFSGGALRVVLNNGHSSFSASDSKTYNYVLSPGVVQAVVDDFNGDDIPDIAVLNSHTNQITLLLSK